MADDPGGLAAIGIRVISLFSGIAGGIVGAWADNKPLNITTWFLCAICSGLTANYLAKDLMHFFPDWMSEGGVGFMLGAAAYHVIQIIRRMVETKLKIGLNG